MSVEERVEHLLAPVVATLAVELIDVEYSGGTLRLTVDGDDGVGTDQLAEVNRLVSPILDQHDPVPGRYTLEVSSPGLERPLRRSDHYRRAIGESVVVKMVPEIEPRRYRGRLSEVDEQAVVVEVVETDGVDLDEPRAERLELSQIASARTVFEWGPSPKPGGPGGKGKKRGKSRSGSRNESGAASAKKKNARSRGVR